MSFIWWHLALFPLCLYFIKAEQLINVKYTKNSLLSPGSPFLLSTKKVPPNHNLFKRADKRAPHLQEPRKDLGALGTTKAYGMRTHTQQVRVLPSEILSSIRKLSMQLRTTTSVYLFFLYLEPSLLFIWVGGHWASTRWPWNKYGSLL